jgi:hypothetical protein
MVQLSSTKFNCIAILLVSMASFATITLCVASQRVFVVYFVMDIHTYIHAGVYPKVSGLAAWSENCKWYISLPLGVVVSLFCETV